MLTLIEPDAAAKNMYCYMFSAYWHRPDTKDFVLVTCLEKSVGPKAALFQTENKATTQKQCFRY